MGAVVKINGVAEQEAVVPFGSTVSLTNGSPGTISQKWEILDYAEDLDDAGPDFATNFSAWTAAGDGTYFVNQTPVFSAVTFKPDVTGAYLVRLTSVEVSGSVVQTAVVRVVEVHSGEYLAAAGETTESGSREGWKKIINGRMKRLGKRMQGCIRVANVSGSSIARGKVVRIVGTIDAHTISPASNPGGTAAAKPEKLLSVQLADNTAAGASTAEYAVLDEAIATNGTGWAVKFGLFEGKTDVSYATFAAGDILYLDNAGGQVNVRPTSGECIPIGLVLETTSGAGTAAIRLGFLSGADKAKLDAIVPATWPLLSAPRYYAVDYDGGNDASAGWSDVSMVAAGAVAVKTWDQLLNILPPQGSGRTVVIAVKPRASGAQYLDQSLAPQNLIFIGLGYYEMHIVATSDFSDSASDRILSGATIASAGPNGDSSWTCAGGGSATSWTVSAGTLPTGDAITMYRVRFSPTTTTAALRNVCTGIYSNTTTAITASKDLAATPQAGDTFFIEKPGVLFNNISVRGDRRLVMRGIAATGGASTGFAVFGRGSFRVSFCESRGSAGISTIDAGGGDVSTIDTYPVVTGGSALMGMAFRSDGGLTIKHANTLLGTGTGVLSTGANFTTIQDVTIALFGSGSVHRNLVELLACGKACRYQSDTNSSFAFTLGRWQSGYRDMSVDTCSTSPGAISIIESSVTVQNTVVTNASVAAIGIDGQGLQVHLINVTGSTGNSGPGLGLQFAGNAAVSTDGTTTVTGSGGDIQFSDATVVGAWADLATTNVVDSAGSSVEGAARRVVRSTTRVTNKSGGALTVGSLVRSNGTSIQATSAKADSSANASGPLLVLVTAPANNGDAYAVPVGQGAWVAFDGTPTAGSLAYLSPGTAAKATVTAVAASGTNQKRRLGHVLTVSGTLGVVIGSPELLPVTADGGI